MAYTRAKFSHNNLDALAETTMIAIGVTYVGYYGDLEEIEWVQAPPTKTRSPTTGVKSSRPRSSSTKTSTIPCAGMSFV